MRGPNQWTLGQKVQWIDDEKEYAGHIYLFLSAQAVVQMPDGTQRFVMYNNPTLKPYRQVV